MIVFGIILIAIALIGGFIYIVHSEDAFSPSVVFLILFMFLGTAFLMAEIQEKETAIECLKGNNPYKMEIRFELEDSIYVSVYTVYVKIK